MNRTTRFFQSWRCAAIGVLLGSSAPTFGKPARVLVTGSSTMAPLVAELALAYEKTTTDTRIEVQTGGSSKGILDCRSKFSDMGMVSRPLKPDELDFKAIPIAQDGLAFIVHRSASIQSLTKEQIISIYRGTLQNWKEVGGADAKIVTMSKAEGRASLELFQSYFGLKGSEIHSDLIIGDEEQGIKTIASTPGSLGYVSISAATTASHNYETVTLVKLDGQTPTLQAVLDGKYTLVRPLNLLLCDDNNEDIHRFSQFISMPAGQAVVKSLGYIPL